MDTIKKMYRRLSASIVSVYITFIPLLALGQAKVPDKVAPIGTGQDKPFGGMLRFIANKSGYKVEGVDEGFLIPLLGSLAFALFSLLGVFFLLLMIYGGFRWMFARGNESEVEKAKDILKHALTGLIIVSGSYALWKSIEFIL